MAAVLQMCMNELGKLGERVEAAKKRPLMFLTKAKEGQVSKAEREEEEEAAAKEISIRKERPVVKDSSSLSEETVFWLMDRFAPL